MLKIEPNNGVEEIGKNTHCDTFFYIKLKISFVRKNIKKVLKTYFSLSHIWISIIILILSFISLGVSVYYYKNNELIYSICANIFAGLITGLVISLISTIKGISLYRTQSKIKWLCEVHDECLDFIKESKKTYFFKEGDFLSEEEKYDKIYELLCLGQKINTSITQGQFNDIYPFNTYKYIKKNLKYDAVEQSKINLELKDRISNIDISTITNNEIRDLFREMDHSIFTLNASIINKIKQLEIKNKVINIT